MKRKLIPFLLLIISLGLISSGCFLGFLDGFKLDKSITIKIEKEIAKSYKNIAKDMDNLHASMLEMNDFFALYYKDVDDSKEYYNNKLNEIKNNIDKVNKEIDDTNNICNKLTDRNSIEKCNSLNTNKEKINSSYEKLENTYNEFIESHDKWLLALAD